ncbi:tetratricopeptide repeat protein [Candidatus Omnitrophota bacterium]
MKKVMRVYLIVLIVLFVLLSFLDGRGVYTLEKKVWKLQKNYYELAKDPQAVSSRTFNDLIEKCQYVIDSHGDSPLSRGVMIMVGQIYELTKDFDLARKMYNDIFEKYKDNDEFSAEAKFLIGKTYESNGEWSTAEALLRDVSLNYMLTAVGMDIPIYIARYYRQNNDYQKTLDAYAEALAHYKSIISSNPDSFAELSAMRLLAKCYFEQNRWKEAIESLGDILHKYGTSSYLSLNDADVIIKTINGVSAFKLKDVDVAIDLYKGLIADDPKRPLSVYLQQMIDGFQQLKEEDDKKSTE